MNSIFLVASVLAGLARGPASSCTDWQKHAMRADGSLDYECIEQKASSLEQILGALPEDYRAKYVLMYRSGSVQNATFENPRAIFYGKNARTLISFNGSPKQNGFDKLEIIHFNDSSNSFEFAEISQLSNGVRVERNPHSCTMCHGRDPRPIWEPYRFWPGAFGGFDDRYYVSDGEASYHQYPQALFPTDQALREGVARDKQGLTAFLENQRALRARGVKNRYSYLVNPDARFAIAESGLLENGPNSDLTRRLSFLNFRRVARLIMATPDYERFRWAIYGWRDGCENLDSFFSPSVLRALDGGKFGRAELERQAIANGRRYEFEYQVGLRRLFEGRGINITDWGMQLSNSYGFDTPTFSQSEFAEAYAMVDLSNAGYLQCEEMAKRSQQALADFTPGPWGDAYQPLTVVGPHGAGRHYALRCIGCHSGADTQDRPRIDFDVPSKLRGQLLARDIYGKTLLERIIDRTSAHPQTGDAMPLMGGPLAPGERKQLIEWLNRVAGPRNSGS